MGRLDPRTTGCKRDVRVDRWSGVEIHEARLQVTHKVAFVSEDHVLPKFIHERIEPLFSFSDRLEQASITVNKAHDGRVIEPGSSGLTLPRTNGVKALEGIVLYGRRAHQVLDFGFNP